jgi:hypothetical protein
MVRYDFGKTGGPVARNVSRVQLHVSAGLCDKRGVARLLDHLPPLT